jgi:hypothetical protein
MIDDEAAACAPAVDGDERRTVREKVRDFRCRCGTFVALTYRFCARGANQRPARSADLTGVCWSERRDLNPGPPVPQTGALTGLRYAPPTGHVYAAAAQGARAGHQGGGGGLSLMRHTRLDPKRRASPIPQHQKGGALEYSAEPSYWTGKNARHDKTVEPEHFMLIPSSELPLTMPRTQFLLK